MDKTHYNVSGLANSEDKTKIKNALEKVDGVQKTAVDMARGTVEVGFNEQTDKVEIKDCIEKTGYKIL